MMNLRTALRGLCCTPNTIRYRVEWPRIAAAWAKVGPIGELFDGGAGSGEFARRALRDGLCRRVVALEFDPVNFRGLRANLGRDPRATLLRGSVLDIPQPDHSADLVMSTQVLEHIAEHGRAAGEFDRILKPGGHAIITTPHPPEPFPNDDHVREGYTETDLEDLFAPHGWKRLHTDYFLVRETTERLMRASRLPAGGRFLPVAWIDRERHLAAAERAGRRPFGILVLFQKPA